MESTITDVSQGSTNGVRHVRTHAYFYLRTHVFGHEDVDTYAHLFVPMVFHSFQNLPSFIILYCLKTYCYVFHL